MQNFAADNFLPEAECDFTLLKSDTYIKNNANETFEHFGKEIVKKYADKTKIINEHIEFEQRHDIVLHVMKECKIKLNYTIDFSLHASHPKIILSPDSIIPHKLYTPNDLLKLLFSELNKIKAYHGIMIRIFDETMIKNLKVLVNYIYAGKFKKRVKIPLFDGIEPIITRKSQLIYWYKEKDKENQVIEVDIDELLVEYKKPIFGKNGFDAFGKIISVDYLTNKDDLEAIIDESSIHVEEDINSKRYISKKRGFVHFINNNLRVDNKINLQKISRNARSIASEENNNIEVVISQHDTNRDSIGEGVSLKSQTIHVDGFVGAKSVLETVNLSIEGATHQDSTQFAKFAKINRHKGVLRCHEAKIGLLEGGEVHASKVEIEACLGGTIYAKDVIIGQVKNNLKVYASNSITINHISGEDNLLQIGYENIPILKSNVEFLDKEIEDLKYTLEQALRHSPDEVSSIKKEIQALKDKQYAIIHSYEKAEILIKNPCRGLNTIIFKIDKEHEIIYKTQAILYTKFHLTINENNITLEPVKKTIQITV